ncbi:prefoldin subunit alpha [Haloplanus salilacus]|uniref:prefoldin subunit alpha n=1 Tax=Haloplanus salilacus TaxID=2949994 RepID=UPI0030D1E6D9
MGGGQQQLQQLSQEIEAIDEEITELEDEIQDLRDRQSDIDEAVEAIETLDSGSTVQVPLGGGAYLRAEVQDIDEVIVDLGGGYAAEQNQGDAVEALERKRDILDDRIDDVQAEIDELESESAELEEQAQQMQQQMQQQQMQQMQQQQGNDE